MGFALSRDSVELFAWVSLWSGVIIPSNLWQCDNRAGPCCPLTPSWWKTNSLGLSYWSNMVFIKASHTWAGKKSHIFLEFKEHGCHLCRIAAEWLSPGTLEHFPSVKWPQETWDRCHFKTTGIGVNEIPPHWEVSGWFKSVASLWRSIASWKKSKCNQWDKNPVFQLWIPKLGLARQGKHFIASTEALHCTQSRVFHSIIWPLFYDKEISGIWCDGFPEQSHHPVSFSKIPL